VHAAGPKLIPESLRIVIDAQLVQQLRRALDVVKRKVTVPEGDRAFA
jgi:hypothetical protein